MTISNWINYYETLLESALLMDGDNKSVVNILDKIIEELKLKQTQ